MPRHTLPPMPLIASLSVRGCGHTCSLMVLPSLSRMNSPVSAVKTIMLEKGYIPVIGLPRSVIVPTFVQVASNPPSWDEWSWKFVEVLTTR